MKHCLHIYLLFIGIWLAPIALHAQDRPGEHEEENEQREYETAEKTHREYQEAIRKNGLCGEALLRNLNGSKKGYIPWQNKKSTWDFLGPMNQGGRMKAIAVSYKNKSIWYAGADGGGLWKSTDAGAHWLAIGDTLPSLRIGSIAISPYNDNLIIAGTQDGLIYRSADAGLHWQAYGLKCSNCTFVFEIQFHPANGAKVLISVDGDMQESSDSGKTWKSLLNGNRVCNAAYVPVSPATIVASLNDESGSGSVQRSIDGGKTWTSTLNFGTTYWAQPRLSVCKAASNVIYLTLPDSNKMYKSTDTGKTWKPCVKQPYRNSYYKGLDYLQVCPTDPNVIVCGTTSLFRSMDGGKTWVAGDTTNKDLHVDQHAFLFVPNDGKALIACNDGGIFYTSDYSDPILSWSARNNQLATLQIYNLAEHPLSEDTIIVGCQDNGYDKYSGVTDNWKIVGGDGFCAIYDYDEPEYFYHEYISQNLHRSGNGFSWWAKKVMGGLPTDSTTSGYYTGILKDNVDWYGQAVIMSPKSSSTLYMGTDHLYKTMDKGDRWRKLSNYTYGQLVLKDYITKLFISPARPEFIYAGTNAGLLYKIKDSAGITIVSPLPSPSLPVSRLRGIAVDSSNPNIIYSAGSGGWQSKGVMKSRDGGKTWLNKSKGLAAGQINCLLIDPDAPNVLYAGHSYGLFYSLDTGESWQRMPEVPRVEIWDMQMAKIGSQRNFLLGTYGRGVIRASGFGIPSRNVGIEDKTPLSLTTMELFPVPAMAGEAYIKIHFQRPEFIRVRLWEISGKEIGSVFEGIPGQDATLQLPTASLKSGIYFVEMQCASGRMTKQLIIH